MILDKALNQADLDKICTEMPWIKDLKIAYNSSEITNIDSLSKLTKLERLSIRKLASAKTQPLNIEPLTACQELKYLELESTPILSADPLKVLTKIEELDLSDCHLSTLSFLEGEKALKVLTIRGFKHTFEDYSSLEELTSLEEINLYANKQATQENLQVLKKLSTLKKVLMIDNSNIISLDFLSGLMNLEHLDIKWCNKLTDISGLTANQKLRKLNLSKCPVTDMSALANNTELYYLAISETGINDFKALVGMDKMKEISLHKTSFSNLEIFKDASDLRTIYLDETKVSSLEPLKNNAKLSTLSNPKTTITDLTPVLAAKNLYSLLVSAEFPESQLTLAKSTIPKLRVRVVK